MRNFMIINIEGLDVSGKETFSKSLEIRINASIENINKEKEISLIRHSFPSYETEIGKRIKEILKTPSGKRDGKLLNYLFCIDRMMKMHKIMKQVESNPTKFHIIILDRYYFSNLLYGLTAEFDECETPEFILDETQSYQQYRMEERYLDNPDIVVMFHRMSTIGTSIHHSLLAEKDGKDANETEEFQSKLQDMLDNLLKDEGGSFLSNSILRQVDIGSNFDTIDLEDEIERNVWTIFNFWKSDK